MKPFVAGLILSAAATAPSLSFAWDSGPYLGIAGGQSKLHNGVIQDLETMGFASDATDTAYKVFVGYDVSPYLAIEASYVDFGDFSARFHEGTTQARLDLGIDGFTLALLSRFQVHGGLHAFGKLGLIAWDGKVVGQVTDNGETTFSASDSFSGTDPFFGLGVEYRAQRLILRAEFERYNLRDSGESLEIDLVSASLGYRF